MSWRASAALISLKREVDGVFPARATESDGFIGDAAHAARKSDHNPDANGIVHAWDITTDPELGVGDRLVEFLLQSRDPRIKYAIFKRRIFDGEGQGHAPWQWHPYTGKDPHESHVHLSVYGDDPAPWGFDAWSNPPEDLDMTKDELIALLNDPKGPLGQLRADVAEVKRQVTKSQDADAPGGRTLRHICAADLNKP